MWTRYIYRFCNIIPISLHIAYALKYTPIKEYLLFPLCYKRVSYSIKIYHNIKINWSSETSSYVWMHYWANLLWQIATFSLYYLVQVCSFFAKEDLPCKSPIQSIITWVTSIFVIKVKIFIYIFSIYVFICMVERIGVSNSKH